MNLVATKNAENAKELGLAPDPQKTFATFVTFAAKITEMEMFCK